MKREMSYPEMLEKLQPLDLNGLTLSKILEILDLRSSRLNSLWVGNALKQLGYERIRRQMDGAVYNVWVRTRAPEDQIYDNSFEADWLRHPDYVTIKNEMANMAIETVYEMLAALIFQVKPARDAFLKRVARRRAEDGQGS